MQELLEAKLKDLKEQEFNAIANLNAIHGAIQLCEQLMEEIKKKKKK